MSYLSFISDENLEEHVKTLVAKAHVAKLGAVEKFSKNVIDPFSAIFEMGGFNMSHDVWKESELQRQIQKTVSNAIGDFHQNVLGSCDGWDNLNTGKQVDLENKTRKIIAEVKNKHNTVKKSDEYKVYDELNGLIARKSSQYKGYTAYYVTIIPQKKERFNRHFTPSNKETGERCPLKESIRAIDGASFYELVTGKKDALRELFCILPKVIQNAVNQVRGESYAYSKEECSVLLSYFDLAFES